MYFAGVIQTMPIVTDTVTDVFVQLFGFRVRIFNQLRLFFGLQFIKGAITDQVQCSQNRCKWRTKNTGHVLGA
jgi:hypothetical protein